MDYDNAEEYRERDSETILDEQKEFEKLRRRAVIGRKASWEYDGKSRKFVVSKAWEQLTGYKAADVFPDLSKSALQDESLFDNLIDDWMRLVAPVDREDVRRKSNQFLLYRTSSDCVTIDYRLLCKDGTEKIVQSTGCSLWNGPKLVSLLVETEDLDSIIHRYLKPEKAAEAIVKSQAEIQENNAHIKNVEAVAVEAATTAETLAEKVSRVSAISKALPIILGALVISFQTLLTAATDARRALSVFLNPPKIEQAESISNDGYLLGTLSDKTIDDIKDALSAETPGVLSLQLGAYIPSPVPGRYKVLIQAGQSGLDIPYFRSEVSTISDASTTARTERHIAEESYDNREKNEFSVPLKIIRNDGRAQVLFVLAHYETEHRLRTVGVVDKLAEKIKGILTDGLAEAS